MLRPALLPLLVALAAPPAAVAAPSAARLDLMSFEAGDAETWERLHRTSDSRPLTLAELEKLAAAGVGQATLVEMMRTRKVLALADADALVRLKKAGADDKVVAAFSAYAYPPNDDIALRVQIDVSTPYSVGQAPFVYIEVWHEDLQRQEAFLYADLRGLLARGGRAEVVRDRSDPLLPSTVRTVRLHGRVPSRHAGRLQIRALVTQRAGLDTLEGLPEAEEKRVRREAIEYPAVSLESRCRLDLLVDRDPLLKDAYTLRRSDVDCRWD
jgi:hypothetical protein